jgi:predicted SprT family Zn-dependent metalloprotease
MSAESDERTLAETTSDPRPRWTPTDDADGLDTDAHRTCECGAHVSARYRRHHADEDGQVHACPECATHAELRNGRATDPDAPLDYALAGVRQ